MFTLQLIRLGSGRGMLVCRFPFALLDAFKATVPEGDRIWHAKLRWWEVTIAGFHALCSGEAERMAPVPPEVLDYVYPWPSG